MSKPHSTTIHSPQYGHIFMEQIDCLDVSLWGREGLIGTSFLVSCELKGVVNDLGFVSDFSIVKSQLKSLCKEHIDHRFLAPTQHTNYKLNLQDNYWIWRARNHKEQHLYPWTYQCPYEAALPCKLNHTDIPEVTPYLEDFIVQIWRKSNPYMQDIDIRIRLHQENQQTQNSEVSFFSYTHGIPNHDGLCHRLWHGHLSQIQVYENHKRNRHIERRLLSHFFSEHGFHIAHPTQLRTLSPWNVAEFGPKNTMTEIAYDSISGHFAATMPADRILLLDHSTSIESMCYTITSMLKRQNPSKIYQTKIYEGPHKGGICTL